MCGDRSNLRTQRAASLDPSVEEAGGPASLATMVALAPWLCVTTFQWFCSEQRFLN
jgi:hypothetical protein